MRSTDAYFPVIPLFLSAAAVLAGSTACAAKDGGAEAGAGGGGAGGAGAGGGGAGEVVAGEVVLSFAVHQWNSLEGIPTPPPDVLITACPVLLPVPAPSEVVLATSGECSLAAIESPPAEPWAVGVGALQVKVSSGGGHHFPASGAVGECLSHEGDDAFLPGDVITFEGQGGGDVAPFALEVPAPPALLTHPGGWITAGEAYEISFSEAAVGVRVELWGAVESRRIVCHPAGTELLVDGALLADIEPINGRVVVSATRGTEEVAASGSVSVRGRVIWQDTYSPVSVP